MVRYNLFCRSTRRLNHAMVQPSSAGASGACTNKNIRGLFAAVNNTPDKLGPLDSVLGFHLQRVAFVFSPKRHTPKSVPRGLLSILSVVSVNPGINQISVSRILGIDAANLVPLIDDFVEKGFIKRSVDTRDRRSRVLSLTAAGNAKLKRTFKFVKELEAKMLTGFSTEERELLTAMLKRIQLPGADTDRS